MIGGYTERFTVPNLASVLVKSVRMGKQAAAIDHDRQIRSRTPIADAASSMSALLIARLKSTQMPILDPSWMLFWAGCSMLND
jgi:hypothetical protein